MSGKQHSLSKYTKLHNVLESTQPHTTGSPVELKELTYEFVCTCIWILGNAEAKIIASHA